MFPKKTSSAAKPAAKTPAVKKPAAKTPAVKRPAAKKTTAKAGPILFKAPSDFKPAFFEISFETLRDGLLRGGSIVVNRVKGRWDNEDAKRYDLAEYDVATLMGIATRLGAMSMAPNVLKRLPPKTKWMIIIRVMKRSATDSISAGIKGIKYLGVGKNDKPKWFWVNTQSTGADLLNYRKIRKMARTLPGAFVEVQLPPSGRRPKKSEETDEE